MPSRCLCNSILKKCIAGCFTASVGRAFIFPCFTIITVTKQVHPIFPWDRWLGQKRAVQLSSTPGKPSWAVWHGPSKLVWVRKRLNKQPHAFMLLSGLKANYTWVSISSCRKAFTNLPSSLCWVCPDNLLIVNQKQEPIHCREKSAQSWAFCQC